MHGLAGAGKTSLLNAFSAAAHRRGVRLIRLDCRVIEPTERGVLSAIDQAIDGAGEAQITDVADRLSRSGERVIVALDVYEVVGFMDTWLRQVLIPAWGTGFAGIRQTGAGVRRREGGSRTRVVIAGHFSAPVRHVSVWER